MSRFYGLFGGGASPTPVEEDLDIITNGVVQSGWSLTPVTNSRSGWSGSSFTPYAPTLVQGSGYYRVNCPSATNATRTGSAYVEIDLTNYKTLKVEFTGITVGTGSGSSTSATVCLVKTMAQAFTPNYDIGGSGVTVGATTIERDVSTLQGKWYLVFNYICNANRNIAYDIKNIHLTYGKPSYFAPINTLALTSPSNTAQSNATARTWTRNSYVKGLTDDNFYYASHITNVTITGNQVTFGLDSSSYASYGVGFVLNANVVADETYEVDYRNVSDTCIMYAMYYNSSGTFIGYSNISVSKKFTVPSNTAYVILLVRRANGSTPCTVEINGVTRVTA